MALLKSVDNVPGITHYEYRDQDYYNKYLYRARFKLEGIRYTWWAKDIEDIKKKLHKNSYGSIRKADRETVTENLAKLDAYLQWRNTNAPKKPKNKDITIRVEYDNCAVFSNDLQLLHTLDQLYTDIKVDYTEVQKSEYSGVKHFVREPKHKYRVYLKSKRIEESFVTDLADLLKRIQGLHPSPALDYWIKGHTQQTLRYWQYRYASSAHFIDYDDESTLSYLALMHGEMLGKKYKLEKRPHPI